MNVTVRLFASLAEREGWREKPCALTVGATVGEAWSRVTGQPALPPRVLCAVNLEYCDPGRTLAAGDEVAFFPPVTGG
ncbi:MAG: MoaD/ThiS family protein [Gammaproteobacteria bacterium]